MVIMENTSAEGMKFKQEVINSNDALEETILKPVGKNVKGMSWNEL